MMLDGVTVRLGASENSTKAIPLGFPVTLSERSLIDEISAQDINISTIYLGSTEVFEELL